MWEISGAEFSQSNVHTADGVSIRFPRVTRIRGDKDWETATNLSRLKVGPPAFVQYSTVVMYCMHSMYVYVHHICTVQYHGDVPYVPYVYIHHIFTVQYYSNVLYVLCHM